MAIISGKHSEKFVEKVMVVLDLRAKYSAYGMAYYADRKRDHGPPTWTGAGWKMGGSNAWLYGRRVLDLRIAVDGTEETIEWTEPEYWANNPETHQPELQQSGARRKVVRNMNEYIGGEPYHRWK